MKRCVATLVLALLTSLSVYPKAFEEITLEDIFTTKNVSTYEEIDQLNRRCQDLDLALEFSKDGETDELIATIQVRELKLPISHKLLEKVYNDLIKDNPYHSTRSRVRITKKHSPLIQEEQKYLAKRDAKCAQALESLFNETVNPEDVPRVAFCCSGGGYRAMLSASGIFKEFEENGLLDTVHYLTGLSGSTWAISTWMLSDKSFSDFHPELLKRTAEGFVGKDAEIILDKIQDSIPTLSEYFIQRLLYKEIPSVIDIYGYFLAISLFSEEDQKNYLTTNLSSQVKRIENGERPFPIYTAITPHNSGCYEYSWLEFTPYEVASDTLEGGVPNWSYGRRFKRGISTNNAPELPLGYLMALWGSAISVNFREVYDIVIEKLQPHAIFAPLEKFGDETVFGAIRMFPARHRNYMRGISTAPYNSMTRQTVIDAGIDMMLPIPPVLKEKRDIDIIIVCDASPDVATSYELKQVEEYARRHNKPFPKIDYSHCWCKRYSIFDDGPDSDAPIVIYIPLIANEKMIPGFDPGEYLDANAFLHTFNLWYTLEEAKIVSNVMQQAAKEVKDDFVHCLKESLERKRTRNK